MKTKKIIISALIAVICSSSYAANALNSNRPEEATTSTTRPDDINKNVAVGTGTSTADPASATVPSSPNRVGATSTSSPKANAKTKRGGIGSTPDSSGNNTGAGNNPATGLSTSGSATSGSPATSGY